MKEHGKDKVIATALAAALVAILVLASNFIASHYMERRSELVVKVYGAPTDLGYECYEVDFLGSSPPVLTDDERVELEQRAVDLALSDQRVKELIHEKQYRVTSILRITFRSVEKGDKLWLVEWDGKLYALVTIIFTDDSGYYIEVNLTDETIEETRFTQSIFP